MAPTVADLLRELDHPLKPAIALVRTTVLGADPRVSEAIKWNSPSFLIDDHFATINVGRKTKARPTDHIMLVLHRGAKARAPKARPAIHDPDELLQWLGTDRAVVTFHGTAEVKQHQKALTSIVKQWIAALAVVLLLGVGACAPPPDPGSCPDGEPWQALLTSHLQRYHAMDIPDAFKLLQQATTGSEHAVPDPASAANWMEREWNAMGNGPPEPMVDTLGVDAGFARVHLRPYRDAGGDPTHLTQAFVATANAATGDTALLGCALAAAASVVPWDSAQWRTESEVWARAGYPAMHHSAGYETAHRPAYRVVGLRQATDLLSEGHNNLIP